MGGLWRDSVMSGKVKPEGALGHSPVVRDDDRFKLLYSNSRADISDDFSEPLVVQTTRAMIADRVSEAKAAKASETR